MSKIKTFSIDPRLGYVLGMFLVFLVSLSLNVLIRREKQFLLKKKKKGCSNISLPGI